MARNAREVSNIMCDMFHVSLACGSRIEETTYLFNYDKRSPRYVWSTSFKLNHQ